MFVIAIEKCGRHCQWFGVILAQTDDLFETGDFAFPLIINVGLFARKRIIFALESETQCGLAK